MKRKTSHFFWCIGFLATLVLAACGTISPRSYSQANAQPVEIPSGQSRITRESLTGVWINEAGDIYAFKGSTFQSNVLNSGKPGSYEINPVLSSYLIVFIKDRNIEGSALFSGHQFFFERNNERDTLNSIFAVLSEDKQTLTLGQKTFFRREL